MTDPSPLVYCSVAHERIMKGGGKTMADCKIPAVRIAKMRSRQQHLIEEITIRLDQFTVMQHEINELEGR